jgi:hypothetical protein
MRKLEFGGLSLPILVRLNDRRHEIDVIRLVLNTILQLLIAVLDEVVVTSRYARNRGQYPEEPDRCYT